MIRLELVNKKDKEKLRNINQKYLYEMTNYYSDQMDSNGNYQYGYFDLYFIEENRKPYFIYNDLDLVGFVFINNYSYFNEEVDYVIAEFTIFPMYRGNGYSKDAINVLFNMYKGNWEIKYHKKNKIAKKLWNDVTCKFNPKRIKYSENEVVLKFNNRGE